MKIKSILILHKVFVYRNFTQIFYELFELVIIRFTQSHNLMNVVKTYRHIYIYINLSLWRFHSQCNCAVREIDLSDSWCTHAVACAFSFHFSFSIWHFPFSEWRSHVMADAAALNLSACTALYYTIWNISSADIHAHMYIDIHTYIHIMYILHMLLLGASGSVRWRHKGPVSAWGGLGKGMVTGWVT